MPMIGKKSSIRWWVSVILHQQFRLVFRADCGLRTKPEIYEYLETRQMDYAIRLYSQQTKCYRGR